MLNLISKILLFFLAVLFSLAGHGQLSCIDSSFRIRYTTAAGRLSVLDHTIAANGDVLATGPLTGVANSNLIYIVRLDMAGNVVWSKTTGLPGNVFVPRKILALSDNSVLVTGVLSTTVPGTLQLFLLKLDPSGNMVWCNAYGHPPPFDNTDYLYFHDAAEAANGDILTSWSGKHNDAAGNDSSYAVICRVNASGQLSWGKAFGASGNGAYTNPAGIFFHNNEALVIGEVSDYYAPAPCPGFGVFFTMGLDYSNGSLRRLNAYCYNEFQSNSTIITSPAINYSAVKMDNSHFGLYGFFHFFDQNFHYFKLVFDEQLNYIQSKTYMLAAGPGYRNTKIQMLPNGETHISATSNLTQNLYWATIDSSEQLIRQRKIPFATTGISNSQYYNFSRKPDGTMNMTTAYQSAAQSAIELVQFKNDDATVAECMGTDTAFIRSGAFTITPNNWAWKWTRDIAPVITPLAPAMTDIPFTKEEFCKQVSVCDSLKISGRDTVCLQGMEEIFEAHKNPACNKRIEWRPDSSVIQAIRTINDSSIGMVFKQAIAGPSQVYLYAAAGDCSVAKDSVKITLLPGLKRLGNDTTLCPGQPLRLTPGNWFKHYLWQDGSADSVYTASAAGTYYVRAEAWCGYFLSDTIHISTPAFNIHRHEVLCAGQSDTLDAGKGLTGYVWQDGSQGEYYHVTAPGIYWVQAADASGCVMADTVYITAIARAPAAFLPADSTMCAYESILLRPVRAYSSYLWNTGSVMPQLQVTQPGLYTLQVTDDQGCRGTDSILISTGKCDTRIIFPNAFSPDNNGHNDVFGPVVQGVLQSYTLNIYNRWGQKIFSSQTAPQGWDGRLAGKLQTAGVYIWICVYQFHGEPAKQLKGSVFLLNE